MPSRGARSIKVYDTLPFPKLPPARLHDSERKISGDLVRRYGRYKILFKETITNDTTARSGPPSLPSRSLARTCSSPLPKTTALSGSEDTLFTRMVTLFSVSKFSRSLILEAARGGGGVERGHGLKHRVIKHTIGVTCVP